MNSDINFVRYILDDWENFTDLFIQHVQLTGLSVLIALVIALPLAVLASRVPSLAAPLNWLANIGQTIPSLAILGLAIPLLGTGFPPALMALTVRAVLPIFLNAYVGIRYADPMVVDAARGMGATGFQRLMLVELPLASPVVFAGVQTATVQNVGIATLAAFIGGGGLGDLILQGLALVDLPVLLAGAVPVAMLALGIDIGMRAMSRVVIPAGLRVTTS